MFGAPRRFVIWHLTLIDGFVFLLTSFFLLAFVLFYFVSFFHFVCFSFGYIHSFSILLRLLTFFFFVILLHLFQSIFVSFVFNLFRVLNLIKYFLLCLDFNFRNRLRCDHRGGVSHKRHCSDCTRLSDDTVACVSACGYRKFLNKYFLNHLDSSFIF